MALVIALSRIGCIIEAVKEYKYILLDWDGNLAKTLDVWLNAVREGMERQGVHLSDEEIGSSFGAFEDYLEGWGIEAKDAEAVTAQIDSIAANNLPKADLYPSAVEVLEDLYKRGKKLALITTSSRNEIAPLFDKHGLNRLFSAIITRHDVTFRKPHAEPLEKALAQLNGTKDEAIMIGDSDKDLGAANNAGIDSILFYPDEHTKFYNIDELNKHKPTYIVGDFKEVLEIVK